MPTLVTLVDGTVPVAADFNGNYTALNNAIGSSTAISTWSTGEIPYASGNNTLARLTPGTVGQVLTMGTSIPGWGNQAVGGAILANDAGDLTNDINVTVGARYSDDALFANRAYMSLTSALIKQLDATWAVGTNAGMRASGAAITDTTYHIFMIMRPDTGVVDIAADTSVTGANLSANTNSAYTKKWRIGSIRRAGGTIVGFVQTRATFNLKVPVNDVNASNPGTSAVLRTMSIPTGVTFIWNGSAQVGTTTATATHILITDPATTDTVPTNTLQTIRSPGSLFVGAPARVRTNTSAQVRTRLDFSDGNSFVIMTTQGWEDDESQGLA